MSKSQQVFRNFFNRFSVNRHFRSSRIFTSCGNDSNDERSEGDDGRRKEMMDGNKMIMEIMTKKGIKDADLMAAQKTMADGYNMLTKGETMMTAANPEGQEMVKEGAKMMLDAQKRRWPPLRNTKWLKNVQSLLTRAQLEKKR